MECMYTSGFILVFIFLACSEAGKDTIIEAPQKNSQSKWIWSWSGQWDSIDDGKPFYQLCESSDSKTNKWLRSNEFLVGDAKRIDVTVEYAVSKCSSVPSIQNCKETLKLYIYKTAIKHTTGGSINTIPGPWKKPEVYHIFGTTSATNFSNGVPLRSSANTETHPFLTSTSTPYHYFAVQYRGGCFRLYSVTISYSVCPSQALPTTLIQLPRTLAPANGTIQVPGSCAENAHSLANNATLYGHCQSNGEWSSLVISGQCLCKSGYGKYPNGSAAVCKDCPPGTFQDTPSGSSCKVCPLNSVQDVDRKKCRCAPSFYRTKDETIFDNCTAQPSAPQDIRATFLNATLAVIEWKTPSHLGGRLNEYYDMECSKCNNEGKACSKTFEGAEVIHFPKDRRKAIAKNLSPYTYYQFKVFSKNGVTHLAEKNGEKPKYAVLIKRTNESIPGVPSLKITFLSSTSLLVSWTLTEKNGIIIFYQISYYPVADESNKYLLNISESSIAITGLTMGTAYYFEVRAATSRGLGRISRKKSP